MVINKKMKIEKNKVKQIPVLSLEDIKILRRELWITQEDMARKLKIDYKTYNLKENWKRPFTFLEYLQVIDILYFN